jgi:hypothetical protein
MPIVCGDRDRGIQPNTGKTVLFKPLSGLFMQGKMLPLRYCNIVVELELVNQLTDPIVSQDSITASGEFGISTTVGGGSWLPNTNTINTDTYSTQWHIYDAQLKCDILTLDSGLENSYAEYLLQGKTIPIPMQVYITQSQALTQNTQETINITRSLTRLKALYITFLGRKAGDLRAEYLKNCNNYYSPLCNSTIQNELGELVHYDATTYWYVDNGHDARGNVLDGHNINPKRSYARTYNNTNELWYQIQLGSKLYPEYMVKSNSEAWYHLSKTLKHQNTKEHGLEIPSHADYNHEFIIGQCLEKVEGASFTGINTKMGDLLTIKLWNQTPIPVNMPNKIFVTMIGDQIMNISDTGIQVFD